MPPKKKISPSVPKKAEVIAAESNDTQLILVILLLVLVYPLGLIFMWYWMKSWPTWLKIIISLPFALGLLAAVLAFAIGMLLIHQYQTNKTFRTQWENEMRIERQKNASSGAKFYLSPSAPVSPTPSSTAVPTRY